MRSGEELASNSIYLQQCAQYTRRMKVYFNRLLLWRSGITHVMLFCLWTLVGFPTLASAEQTAQILWYSPEITATTRGRQIDLHKNLELPMQTVLKSNESGKAELSLPDNSTLTIGPNTEIDLSSFGRKKKSDNILLKLGKGAARLITNKLKGVNADVGIQTPQVTIGIRGTTVVANAREDSTIVYLAQTSGAGIEVIDRATGQIFVMQKPGWLLAAGPDGVRQREATASDLRELEKALGEESASPIPQTPDKPGTDSKFF